MKQTHDDKEHPLENQVTLNQYAKRKQVYDGGLNFSLQP